jgi:hypothetical protein
MSCVCPEAAFCLVREQADGVLSSAAVPRVGLGPTPPPLCRCAEYTADLFLETWCVFNGCMPTMVTALVLDSFM